MSDTNELSEVQAVGAGTSQMPTVQMEDLTSIYSDKGTNPIPNTVDVSNFIQDMYLTTSGGSDDVAVGYSKIGDDNKFQETAESGIERAAINGPTDAASAENTKAGMPEDMMGVIEETHTRMVYKTVMMHVAWGMAIRMSKDITSLVKGG
ncbi:MAG: hypothetical protein AAGF53_02495 [Pseudomonadota bacterium]